MTTPLISKYVLASYNGGAHLLVGRGRWLFDFWPSSEKWCQRGGSNNGQGVAGLLELIQPKQVEGLGSAKARSGRWDGVGR